MFWIQRFYGMKRDDTTQNNHSAVECVTYDKDYTDEASNSKEYDKKRMMKSIEPNLFFNINAHTQMHLNY